VDSLCGISVPIGITEDEGLPVGLEIDGISNTDNEILSIAMAFENIFDKIKKPERIHYAGTTN